MRSWTDRAASITPSTATRSTTRPSTPNVVADRLTVMKNGRVVGTARTTDVDHDEVLGMIIAGKCPPGAIPGPGALQTASAAA